MKKFYPLIIAAVFFCASGSAQSSASSKKTTFREVQHSYEKKFTDQNTGNSSNEEYLRYKEWEWFNEQRTFPGGTFPDPEILIREYRNYRNTLAQTRTGDTHTQTANWIFLGPDVVPANGGGAGRINCMAIDPANAQNIFVGAACGGLWKSIDGGATWSSNTDLLPAISISDIAIDPANTQVMYLATGDKYGIYFSEQTWGQYSAGILKSTDGGATWNTTGMNYSLFNNAIIQRLIIDPSNTNILFAATNSGIFKTTDGGTTWNIIRNGNYYDIEMNPSNDQIIYSGDSLTFIRSTDGGTTWNVISGLFSNGRISIAVTPANANDVYVWSVGGGFYFSTTSGASFVPKSDPSFAAQPYGYEDKVLEVSPVNANVIFVGGMLIARSINGGTNWATVSNATTFTAPNYVHSNEHALLFAAGSDSTVFSCNDGGIFKTINRGTNWSDLSNGLAIKQYYRLGSSALTPNLIYAGASNNGTDRITAVNTATRVNSSEGMECLVDFTNDNIVFSSQENGAFFKSTDGGVTFNSIPVTGCDWTSPMIMDPNDHNKMYAGGNDIYESTDNGNTWSNLTFGGLDGSCVYSLEICSSYPNYIYAATFGNLYRTTDGGITWTNITGTLPVSSAAISGITISDVNPDAAWITFSGFSNGNKVYYTNNGGTNWSNFSGTLPDVPANCIEFQNGSNNLLYLGTDLGVFYRDASMSDWLPYNTGLPNVIIDELEINYGTSKLRAATYGRGMWESDLQTSTVLTLDASAYSILYPPLSLCDSVIAPLVRIRNAGMTALDSVEIHWRMDAQSWQMMMWYGNLATLATANVSLPAYTLTAGAHTFDVFTANPNGGTDMNNYNDTLSRTFTLISPTPAGSVLPPVVEGFETTLFPPANWTIENSTNLLARSTAVGAYGLSSASMFADFYNIAAGNDKMISPYIDFTNVMPPIRLRFDLAYAPYDSVYIDTFAIDLYSDCSGIGERIYTKSSFQMNTAGLTGGVFVPNISQWRSDTLNLDSLAGHLPMEIRFLAISGYGNDLYIDNINLTGNMVGIAPYENNSSLNIYPNPSSGEINIQLHSSSESKVEIHVCDVTGKTVQEKNFSANEGMNYFSLDVSALSDGIYFVKVLQDGTMTTKKISVIR
ncbi:MAG: T9SS type A sorting domain-containing protein [Bacteroidetes bacterium]|nr:T9SS type A sorting domain-containing protein [Bacteroidota bacterium]